MSSYIVGFFNSALLTDILDWIILVFREQFSVGEGPGCLGAQTWKRCVIFNLALFKGRENSEVAGSWICVQDPGMRTRGKFLLITVPPCLSLLATLVSCVGFISISELCF